MDDDKLHQANLIEDGKSRCFFNDNLSTLLYFFVLTGPMLLFNLVLFLLFSWSLCCGVWAGTDLALSHYRKNFKRILIMFFTLGLPWICDLIGFITMWWYEKHNMTYYAIKTVLNVITASQGILMFASIFLFDSSMRTKCGCKSETETQPKSIQMSKVQKSKKKPLKNKVHIETKQNNVQPLKSKRQTPVMISYKRKQHSLNEPNI